MTHQNKALSEIFHNIASIYKFKNGENRFRALAYENASRSIAQLPYDLTHYLQEDELEKLPGIGESLEKDIRSFVKTGHVPRFDSLKKTVPVDLLELMDITGFGPQSLKTIYKKLHLRSRDEVIQALRDGTISKLKGFGPRKVENMLRGLKLHKTVEERMLLPDALDVGNKLVDVLKAIPGVWKVELAGSLRRRKETIGDIDILVSCEQGTRKLVINRFTAKEIAARVLSKGEMKASILLRENDWQADLRIVSESEWGSALQYFTGSKEHNIQLRTIAKGKGFKINEYGIFSLKSGKWLAGKNEEDIYARLGMQWMPPEMREDKGEIELASHHRIPHLIDLCDIRGDLQMHSTGSDGSLTLDELVQFSIKNFVYDYIAVTDHTKSSRIAGGMEANDFIKQIAAIQRINKNLGSEFLKSGAEVDILADGSLDLPNEVLVRFDWVTASIHSGFKKDNTERLIKACENPYVYCIGHPTGRLIGSREPYSIDFDKFLRMACKTNTALEINAQPNRLDLNDELIRKAREHHVKLVISTDSHTPNDFYFMKLGVFMARRAWCTIDDILNTKPWKEIEKFKSQKRLSLT
jgi:DNA polymerase (family 10)